VPTTETTALLRELAEVFPIPDGRWHRYDASIRACRRDFDLSIRSVESDRRAIEALEILLERDALEKPDDLDAAVVRALARLDGLPAPEGQHPFIAEILPTLHAMRAVLYAVAASPGATGVFCALQQEDDRSSR
jgi:hypothetical protein